MKIKKPLFIALSLLGTAAVYLVFFIYSFSVNGRKINTADMRPDEMVYLLADYWSAGNTKGVSDICAGDFDLASGSIKPYSFYDGVIRPDVKISECKEIPIMSEGTESESYLKYYDRHYYRVQWNSDKTESDWRGGGFAFVLVAREEADSPYKICSMFTGW